MILGKYLSDLTYKTGELLCRNRRKKWASTFGQLIKALYFSFENHNYNFYKNGERFLLTKTSKLNFKIIFDVGANIGSWTKCGLKSYKNDADFYVFEIIPDTFKQLKESLPQSNQLNFYNFGFGSQPGDISINYSKTQSSLSSVYTVEHPNPCIDKIKVHVDTLDNFTKVNNIGHIDLLKIDTEGMDYEVLMGAEELLSQKKVKVIQFEYGFKSVETGFLLKDFYKYLNQKGYLVGKLFPNYVDFKPYHRTMEDFIGPNFVAVKNDEKRIIETLTN